jgi:ABC-type multidrug transport system permease subunit
MVAAFLPLPPNPNAQMMDAENNGAAHPTSKYHKYLIDEIRYESARWWRNLNRVMSFIGLLIIGAVVALAVVGVRQRWGQS